MSLPRPLSWLIAPVLVMSVGCTTAPPAVAQSPAPPPPAPTTTAPSTPASPAGRSSDRAEVHGSFAPYGEPASSVVRVPKGFLPFSLQDVGRHGSRASVNPKPVERVQASCAAAATSGQLTSLGAQFCAEVAALGTAMGRVGYGRLSPRGQEEWQGIGGRTAQDYRAFFVAAAKTEAPILFVSSSSRRAKDSSNAFRSGIQAKTRGLDLNLTKRTTDNDLLRFPTPLTDEGRAEVDKVKRAAATQAAASRVLRRLFGDEPGTLDDARAVWELYAIAGGMWMNLDGYLKTKDAQKLAALDDAETFYHYGPGVKGNTAFASAAPLRDDILAAIEDRLAGGTTMATFRHGHAETIAPLAALLRLGPSSRPVAPGASASKYGWLGSKNVRMGSNIDVAAYKKGSTVLVTVRYNERPVRILDCKSSTYGKYFYDFERLKQCWS